MWKEMRVRSSSGLGLICNHKDLLTSIVVEVVVRMTVKVLKILKLLMA